MSQHARCTPAPPKNSFYGNFQFVHVNPPWSARKILCEFVTRQTRFYAQWGRKIDKKWSLTKCNWNRHWRIQSKHDITTEWKKTNSRSAQMSYLHQISTQLTFDWLYFYYTISSVVHWRPTEELVPPTVHLLICYGGSGWKCASTQTWFLKNLTLICETFENLNTHDHQNQMPFLFIYKKNHLFMSGQTFNLF